MHEWDTYSHWVISVGRREASADSRSGRVAARGLWRGRAKCVPGVGIRDAARSAARSLSRLFLRALCGRASLLWPALRGGLGFGVPTCRCASATLPSGGQFWTLLPTYSALAFGLGGFVTSRFIFSLILTFLIFEFRFA